jgi:manganese/zinc/iron transport system permease protein
MKNPYWGNTFFTFFQTLLERVYQGMIGKLKIEDLVSDEIQLLVLSFIAISCAVVGVFLVLKKMTMLANALSHTILLGIICAFILFQEAVFGQYGLSLLLFAGMVTAIITALFTHLLCHTFQVQEDAAIGLVFTFLFALGIITATLYTKNVHIGLETIMGNADALHIDDLKNAFQLLGINIFIIFFFFRPFLLTTFDPLFSKNSKLFYHFYHYLFFIQVSWTAVSCFRAIGVLLVLGFFVGPYLIARTCSYKLRRILWYAPILSCFIVIISIALNRHFLTYYGIAFSTAALIGSVLGSSYLLLLAGYFVRKKFVFPHHRKCDTIKPK